MPTYDYACKFCEHKFEHFQGLNDKKLRKCPECGRNGLERLFGIGAGVVFKGSGFYETDYKRASSSKPDSSGSDSAKPKGSKGADSKADKKVGKAKPPKGGDKS